MEKSASEIDIEADEAYLTAKAEARKTYLAAKAEAWKTYQAAWKAHDAVMIKIYSH